ncbi:MAG: glycerate kinase [Chloroflexi bacterium]|nr:glycerate kinase [Chloroflexota bacterium]
MSDSLRASVRAIFRAALDAADPRAAIQRAVKRNGDQLRVADRAYDLARVRDIYAIGFGKASAPMAQAIEEILGERIARGAVNVKYNHTAPLKKILLHEAGHPLPDENSLRGTEKILAILGDATPDDLIICLISGGGSSLLELPARGISLNDLRVTTDALLRSGATINELNAVRKHLSQVKGGQLARRANGAQIISLILSDVIGSPLDTIASGPTAPDATTFQDAINVIEQRELKNILPPAIVTHLQRGARGEISDTPKPTDPIFARAQHAIIADNALACDAAMRAANEMGFNARLLSTTIQGEARDVAKNFAARAKEIASRESQVCLIAGGETTVTVRRQGKGGRNQEFALASAIEIAGTENIFILSAGTDGTDGPTDAAGACADGKTIARASALGLNARAYLENNDAYNFFQPLGDLFITGATNTNVNDVMIALITDSFRPPSSL